MLQVKSFWLGSRGLLLLRVVILIYLADILTVDGLSGRNSVGFLACTHLLVAHLTLRL